MQNENDFFEILKPVQGYDIHYALFDFDGTISLIREGWQNIMIPYFVEVIRETKTDEDDKTVQAIVQDFVDTLTGKQTVFQCMRLAEEVELRGGVAKDPLEYKKEYLRRLETRIESRKKKLASGEESPENYMVPGVMNFVKILRGNGIKCYLASGTDEQDVLYEARLLGIDDSFEGGIHGAHDETLICSKELVIRDMLEKEDIKANELVSFGDGYVEVELVAGLGGLAVGVATNEETRCGVNMWKRKRLMDAGAAVIVPDFSESQELFRLIGG